MTRKETLKGLILGNHCIADSLYEYVQDLQLDFDRIGSLKDSCSLDKYDIISVFLEEDSLAVKSDFIKAVAAVNSDSLITINIEAIDLIEIQNAANSNVLGLNFSYPVKASPFMEIVKTELNHDAQIKLLEYIGRNHLNLDPFVCENVSVRAYLLSAMAREALSLVDNGYANVESIDRACRNDAGYYLPFTGNFLYMDLMGTMAYSLVMKDLNPELAKDEKISNWLLEKVEKGNVGMKEGSGFYDYNAGDFEAWQEIMNEFSDDISQVITKYKKDYQER